MKVSVFASVLVLVALQALLPSHAAKKSVIDARVKEAIKSANETISEFPPLREEAYGMLVIPSIKEAGFIIGGAYGEGALLIDGRTVGYYSYTKGSAGLQAGLERHDLVLLFLEETALDDFRESNGWKGGVEGKVTLLQAGAQADIDSTTQNTPAVGFTVGQRGLLGGISVNGGKFNKIDPK